MKKILIATEKPFAKEAMFHIEGVVNDTPGYELERLEKYKSKQELIEAVEQTDALIVRSDQIDEEIINASNHLKVIVRAGAGIDNIDLNAASKKKIVVMNTPGQNSNAVAELAIGLMLGLIRHKYNGTPGTELRWKKIAMHGFGNIGKRMAEIAKGFDMKVYAFDPFIGSKYIKSKGVNPCDSVEDLYKKGDFISINIPATPETRESINYDLLSATKPNAFLVNTARKDLIEEKGLIRILGERPEFMYAADVAPAKRAFIEENFPMQTLFTTNKMGAQTAEANINAGVAAVRQIISYIEEGDNKYQVNKEEVDSKIL